LRGDITENKGLRKPYKGGRGKLPVTLKKRLCPQYGVITESEFLNLEGHFSFGITKRKVPEKGLKKGDRVWGRGKKLS